MACKIMALAHYSIKLNYGIMALQHLQFMAFYYSVTARVITVKKILMALIF
jgi:hypothetical protein